MREKAIMGGLVVIVALALGGLLTPSPGNSQEPTTKVIPAITNNINTNTIGIPKDTYTTQEVAELEGVNIDTVYRRAKDPATFGYIKLYRDTWKRINVHGDAL